MKIETLTIGDFNINLPVGMEETLDTPVRDSYQTFLRNSTNDVRRHLTCATTLLPPVLNEVFEFSQQVNVFHPFGGVGATAQVIDQALGMSTHTFWERDPSLVKFLSERYDDVTLVDDSIRLIPTTDLSRFDVILLDMSVGTIKTKGVPEIWDAMAKWLTKDKIIWFTDTACHKIHLNYKTYGKDFGVEVEPNAESYLSAYNTYLNKKGMTITAAMREAGEIYAVVRTNDFQPFKIIPYV